MQPIPNRTRLIKASAITASLIGILLGYYLVKCKQVYNWTEVDPFGEDWVYSYYLTPSFSGEFHFHRAQEIHVDSGIIKQVTCIHPFKKSNYSVWDTRFLIGTSADGTPTTNEYKVHRTHGQTCLLDESFETGAGDWGDWSL